MWWHDSDDEKSDIHQNNASAKVRDRRIREIIASRDASTIKHISALNVSNIIHLVSSPMYSLL